jgi:hypothetical protein
LLVNSIRVIGDGALDVASLMQKLHFLRLKNQQLSVTFHTIDINDEPRLLKGLVTCKRIIAIPAFNVSGSQDGIQQKDYVSYIEPSCLWDHIQHHGETISAKRIDTGALQHLVLLMMLCFYHRLG